MWQRDRVNSLLSSKYFKASVSAPRIPLELCAVQADALLSIAKILYAFLSYPVFPLVSSKLSSPDIVCANQRCFLLQICKVELPYQCLPSFHQCLQNAAFHSPAFLPCVALAFHLSCLNASGLGTGTASTTANLSSNSTSPPLPHAMHKCFSVSCLAALFPSLPQ